MFARQNLTYAAYIRLFSLFPPNMILITNISSFTPKKVKKTADEHSWLYIL